MQSTRTACKYYLTNISISAALNVRHQNKAKNMRKQINWILVSLGVFFLLLLFVIALYVPNPSAFQYLTFRTLLALGVAAFVAVLPGFLEVKFANQIRATGALAAFLTVLLLNPAPQLVNLVQPSATTKQAISPDVASGALARSASSASSVSNATPSSDGAVEQSAEGTGNENKVHLEKSTLPLGTQTPSIKQKANGNQNRNTVTED